MAVAISSPTRIVVRLVHASVNALRAKARDLGAGGVHPQWPARMEMCERCPMRVVQCGKSYCGKPFLQLIEREEHTDGCGCPTREKARDPSEHCPRDTHFEPARTSKTSCNCVWCTAA